MSRAQEILLDRSVRYLMQGGRVLDRPALQGSKSAYSYGWALLENIAAVLKLCLDEGDLESFRKIESEWHELGASSLEGPGQAPRQNWRSAAGPSASGWRCGPPTSRDGRRLTVLRTSQVPWHCVSSARASTGSRRSSPPTSERPTSMEASVCLGETGSSSSWARGPTYIPTSPELLFTALLLATSRLDRGANELEPRSFLAWRKDEIEQILDRLTEEKVAGLRSSVGKRMSRRKGATQTQAPRIGSDALPSSASSWKAPALAGAPMSAPGCEVNRLMLKKSLS